ncbi:MAG: ABC transporter substrate-binding protein [bacterium]|nr:ABC transporter substrate-binding protein [bacterium]
MRKAYWYFTAYIRKHGLMVIASLAVAIGFFSFVVPIIATRLEKRERFYIGIIGQYSIFSLPEIITDQLSVGLTAVTEDGDVVPVLAQRWAVEQGGKTYRFVLKENLVWSDGNKVLPEEMQFSLKDTTVATTAHDLIFQLPAEFSPFPSLVAKPLLKMSEQKVPFSRSRPLPVGIGDHYISDYSTRNNQLKELVVDSEQERYIYRFYQTEDDAQIAFKQGKIDLLLDLVKQHEMYDWPTTTVTKRFDDDRYVAIFFNLQDPLMSKNTRQALSYITSKPTDETRAIGPISKNSWAYLPGGKTYEKDWERGLERLFDDPPQLPLLFTLTTTPTFSQRAESVKKEWEEFGTYAEEQCLTAKAIENKDVCPNMRVKVTLKISNFPDTNDFQLLLIGQESPADPDQYHLWHSDQTTNFTHYKNTRIDNLLEKGRQTFEQAERKQIYQEFQQFILEDPPAIFLEHLLTYDVSRK